MHKMRIRQEYSNSNNIFWQVIYKKYLIIFILIFSVAIGLLSLKLAEFSNDDGKWCLIASGISEGIGFPLNMPSNYLYAKFYESALCAYLHSSVFYLFSKSPYSLRYFAVFLNALSILLTFILAKRLYNTKVALISSFLYSTAPAFVVFYNTKSWQLMYLPVCIILFYYFLHKIKASKSHYHFIFLSLVYGITLNVQALTILLVIVIYIYMRQDIWNTRRLNWTNWKVFFLSLICISFLLIPYIKQINSYSLLILLVLATLILVLEFIHFILKNRSAGTKKLILTIIVLAIIIYIQLHTKEFPIMLKHFYDLVPSLSPYIASHIGMDTPKWLKIVSLFSIEGIFLVIFLIYVIRNIYTNSLKDNDKLLFLWIAIPLSVMYLSTGYTKYSIFHSGNFPHQWFIFLFPAPFIIIGNIIDKWSNWTKTKIMKILITIVIIYLGFQNIYFNYKCLKFVSKSGGVGWHTVNLGVKKEVIEKIYQIDSNPKIILLATGKKWSSYEYLGWVFLSRIMRKNNSNDNDNIFYLLEKDAFWYESIYDKIVEEITIIRTIKNKSVNIIISHDYYPKIGLEIE